MWREWLSQPSRTWLFLQLQPQQLSSFGAPRGDLLENVQHAIGSGRAPKLISPGTLGNTSLTFAVLVSPNKEILPVFAYSTLQPLSQFWKLFLIYGFLSGGCHPACQLCLKANAK